MHTSDLHPCKRATLLDMGDCESCVYINGPYCVDLALALPLAPSFYTTQYHSLELILGSDNITHMIWNSTIPISESVLCKHELYKNFIEIDFDIVRYILHGHPQFEPRSWVL